jgi:hypothetical protein
MEKQEGIPSDKVAQIFAKETCVHHTKYDLISFLIDDQDQLDDTYNLEKNIKRTRHATGNYDYDNVLNIVKEEEVMIDGNTIELITRDLLKDYTIISSNEVAWSNKWYPTWTADVWYEHNLKLSFDFMESHCSEELWDKTIDQYNRYYEAKMVGRYFLSS